MKTFQIAVERLGKVHEARELVGLAAGPQQGVAEVSRGQRAQVSVTLVPHRVRRLRKDEKLVLEPRLQREPMPSEPAQHGLQQRSWAKRMRSPVAIHELADEERASFVGQPALAVGHQAILRIGETGMPAGVGAGIVELVVHVPAENAIAEAATLLHQRGELREADILAANDAIDVGQPQLDTAHPPLAISRELLVEQFQTIGHVNSPGLATPRCADFNSREGFHEFCG